jgi:hypothetical protein
MKSDDQMQELVDILLDFDANDDQPVSDKVKLFWLATQMKNNSEIYGDVRKIVTELCNNIQNGHKINYGLVAADICEYI